MPGGDCQKLASENNGGGHFNAAGFFLDKQNLKQWL